MKIPGYRVHRKIGKGGMAHVFLATQESFGRKVALKIIANKDFGNLQLAERFAQEAKIVAGLSHPHIVPVYDVGRIGNDYQYLAMDYLSGGDLSHWIKTGLQPGEIENVMIQIAGALNYAHTKGYVHRDVKPDNILFREDYSAVLTDFGIARRIKTDTNLTQNGLVVGTPAYMSPEQSEGKPIDSRSDLYSLGVIFYFMLTRQLPYQGEGAMAVAMQHIQSPVPQLPANQKHFQPVIDRLMAKSPGDRFQSGLELIKTIQSMAAAANLVTASTAATSVSPSTLALVPKPEKLDQAAITVEENTSRKWGVLTRFHFNCQLCSQDTQHFTVIFGQFTTRLLAWHDLHGKRCGSVVLTLLIPEILFERAHEAVQTLKHSDAPYDFLTTLPFTVSVLDNRGKITASL